MSAVGVGSAPAEARGDLDAAPLTARQGLLRALWRSKNGRIGLVLVGIVVAGAISAALGGTPYDPQFQNASALLQAPSWGHPFGTDQFGRDIFSLVFAGLGVSFEIAAVSVLIAAGIGSIAGVIAGFLGKWTSAVIMRTTDMLFAIPAILLALIVVAALGAGWRNSAIAIGVGYIPIFVRVVRGPVLTLRESGYVLAGRVLGFSRRRLLFRHILPNVSGILAVQVSLALAWSILADASLSFLGLGPPPPTASLGEMVSQSGSLAQLAWWTLAFPSIAIIVAVIGFNLLGDGLRDAIDPRTRKR
jgi:peptide/nickel transport system permease protein